jgi:hypothetical protein
MILPYLFIDVSASRGRGVFTRKALPGGTLVEASPVIVMKEEDRVLLDQTLLHDYIFLWGEDQTRCCLALGYLSLYNHNYRANCDYEMDFDKDIIQIITTRDVKKGEELCINYNGNWNDDRPLWFIPE